MNKTNNPFNLIKLGLATVALAVLTGCAGYVDEGGGGYGGTVVVPGPDVGFYGGGFYGGGVYERGGDVHGYSHRGSASRGVAHGGHGGGGRGGKR